MRRPLSVGTRWALLYTVATLLALSVPIGFIYASVDRQVHRDARLLLASYLSEVRVELESHPEEAGAFVAAFTDALNRISPDLEYGAVFVPAHGGYSFRVGSLARADAAGDARLRSRAALAGGELEVVISQRSFDRSLGRIRWAIGVAAPLALALSTLCGAWLARRSLRPIARMTASARQISGERLADRIPLRGTGDELDRLAETLNGMFDRLSDAMERLRGFSADAAHQLKSPLSALQNEIEATLGAGRVDAATRRLLEGLLERVGELSGCVGAMLRLARSESGLCDGQAGPVDLPLLLDGVASLFQPLAEERGIALELRAAPPVLVQGDVAWLRELFANLVQNAIEHTRRGGRIELSLAVAPDVVSVAVRDDGEGIDPAEQERIFDRFHRVSPSRDEPGSGLGLTLARQIARAHGGDARCLAREGGGTVLEVTLGA